MAKGKVSLPKGFTSIGGIGESWKPNKVGESLQGTMLGKKTVKVNRTRKEGKKTVKVKEPVNVYTIRTTDGGEVQVWESAGLRALASVKKGAQVYIALTGKKVITKGQQPMRQYTVATKAK